MMIQNTFLVPFTAYENDAFIEKNLKPINIKKKRLSSKSKKNEFKYKKNPVVFMANGIGDGFLALPTIRALANYYYNRLTLIYDASIFPTWVCDLPLKSIILVEVNRNEGSIDFDYFSVANIINDCDLFISLNYGKFQHIRKLYNLLSADCNIGFDPVFDIVLKQPKDKHASEDYFEAIKIITQSIDITEYCYPPKILMSHEAIVKKLFSYASDGLKDDFILAIHTDTQYDKMWNEWEDFIDKFFINFPNGIIYILGSGFNFKAKHARIFDFTRMPFEISIGLLSHSHAFVGIDSCLLHIADLLNLIGIGLFFCTEPIVYGFKYTARYKNIISNKDYYINPTQVIEELKKLVLL